MPLIINVRGGHGAGKSTLVRRVLDEYGPRQPSYVPGRNRPLYYTCVKSGLKPLMVLGTYENPTGGCDTIQSIDGVGSIEVIFSTIRNGVSAGMAILFEGIVAQHSAGRLLDLNMEHPVDVVVLDTSLEDCVDAVRKRRAERGAGSDPGPYDHPISYCLNQKAHPHGCVTDGFDPKNVVKEWKSVQSSSRRLVKDGLPIKSLSREAAFQYVMSQLQLSESAFSEIAEAPSSEPAPSTEKCPTPGCSNPQDGNSSTGQCLDCVGKILQESASCAE